MLVTRISLFQTKGTPSPFALEDSSFGGQGRRAPTCLPDRQAILTIFPLIPLLLFILCILFYVVTRIFRGRPGPLCPAFASCSSKSI